MHHRCSGFYGIVPLILLAVLALCLAPERMESSAHRAAASMPPQNAATPQGGAVPDLEARLRAHIDSLASAGGTGSRVVFTEGNRRAVAYVLRAMANETKEVRSDTFMVRRRSTRANFPLVNPVAVVRGVSDSLIVVAAHIDASASRDGGWDGNWMHMRAPGADDNASGIAAMLETLALVAHAPARPHYTVMFVACNGEERNPDYAGMSRHDGHHLGSRWLARMLKQSGAKVKGAIVMDMVGWNPRGNYTPVFSSGRSLWMARELVALQARLRLDLELGARCGPCDKSDNDSFDRVGIPAVLLMESCAPWRNDARHPRNPGYHSSRDTRAYITWPILFSVTRLVAAYAMSQ
ncbi:MAG: M20/M25/M40 family metallo-hydrolase [Bacteroidetes bacterium]|nr:M20/M25/M40 family metallo-hydrolase [Bacteroidota bacterium]